MGLLDRLRGRKEERGSDAFLRFEDIFSPSPNTQSGVYVDQQTALTLPAVYRCVSLNAQTIASLPVDVFARRGDNWREPYPEPPWLQNPSAEYDWMQFIQEVQTGLELDGNAFLLKIVSDDGRRLVGLLHLAPQMVEVRRNRTTGELEYVVQTDSGSRVYSASQVVHIKAFTTPRSLRGLSPIRACMETVGQGLGAQQFGARFFGEGATLSGVIEVPGALQPEAAERLKEAFRTKHGGVSRSHAIGVLTGGAKWTPLSVKPEEAQFLETQRFTAEQIALLFGVPPRYVSSAEGTKGYVTGVMAERMMWLQFGLLHRIVRLERTFSALLPRPAYIKFNLRAFLRPDAQEQAALMRAEIELGVRTRNEWRALLDLDPLPGSDEPLVPLNLAPAAAAGGEEQ